MASTLLTGIVSYYKLDETSGNAADSVGSNTLINNGTILYDPTYGIINNGASLSPGQMFTLGAPISTQIHNISISFWVDLASASLGGAFFHNGSIAGVGTGYSVGVGSGIFDTPGNELILLEDNTAWIASGINIGTGKHHIMIVDDGVNWLFYIDSVLVFTQANTTSLVPDSNFRINYDTSTSPRQTTFNIDEFGFWNRTLIQSEVSQLYNGGAGFQYPFKLSTNLVSYWKLDETSGNAVDSVGSNTLTNVNTATYSAGKINNAVHLAAASTQYLDITDATQVGLTPANFTVSLWADFDTLTATRALFVKNLTTGWANPYVSYMLRYDLSATKFEFGISDGTTYSALSAITTLATGTYYHIVAIFDGANLSVYVNNSLVGSLVYTAKIGYGTGDFMLGYDNGGDIQDGYLDEVGFWSRALTSTEVTELYNSGVGLQYPFTVLATTKTTLATSRIQKPATQTTTGTTRITASTIKTTTAVSRITATTQKTTGGVASIAPNTFDKASSGVANIIVPKQQSISGVSRIENTYEALSPKTITLDITTSADDGYASGATLYPTDAYISGYDGATNTNTPWARFQNVQIPQGARILSASFVATAYSTQSADLGLFFGLNTSDNATNPTTATELWNIARTNNYGQYSQATWTAGVKYTMPGMEKVVQEITDRPGWVSGNAMMALPIAWDSTYNRGFYFYSFDGDPTKSVQLVITYASIPLTAVARITASTDKTSSGVARIEVTSSSSKNQFGSGGGGGATNTSTGAGALGTSGQGNDGGTGTYSGGLGNGGGGGGGAGDVGASPIPNTYLSGGIGGVGLQSSISGTATYYAGGGGGGSYFTSGASGGLGGGGHGGGNNTGSPGTANTGGGGGGGGWDGHKFPGGSGIVILSIPTGIVTNPTTAGGTYTTSGGNDIWTFLASGTWTPTISITSTVNYLIVAGGGSGGYGTNSTGSGGGGGGGGLLSGIRVVNSGIYNVVVGDGGIGTINRQGLSGGLSSVLNIVAKGGGGGGGDIINYTNAPFGQLATSRIQTSQTRTITAVSNIVIPIQTKTTTAISRIQKANTATTPATSRITSQSSKTTTATAKIQKTTDKTILGISHLQATNIQSTSGTSRIEIKQDKTSAGISRIQTKSDKTETGTSRIIAKGTKTTSATSRLQKNVTATTQGKTRVETSATKSIVGVSHIGTSITKIITATSKINVANDKVISAIANINADTLIYTSGVSLIKSNINPINIYDINMFDTILFDNSGIHTEVTYSVSRILLTYNSILNGISKIKNSGMQILSAKSRVENSSINTSVATSRIEISSTYTSGGISRITTSIQKSTTSISRIQNQGSIVILGKSRIQIDNTNIINGRTRISVTTDKTTTGKARLEEISINNTSAVATITANSLKTITAKSRVTANSVEISTGITRIKGTIYSTTQGRTKVTNNTLKPIIGISRIQKSINNSTQGTTRIYGTSNKSTSSKSRIEIDSIIVSTGTSRVQISSQRTVQAISRITKSEVTTSSATTRIEIIQSKTTQALSRIGIVTSKITQGTTKIQKITIQATQSIARVKVSTTKTISGVANIRQQVSLPLNIFDSYIFDGGLFDNFGGQEYMLGTSSMATPIVKTNIGLSRIQKIVIFNLISLARVLVNIYKVTNANSRIVKSLNKTLSGISDILVNDIVRTTIGNTRIIKDIKSTTQSKSRIHKKYDISNIGVANIQSVINRTIVAQSLIEILNTKISSGVAKIVPALSNNIFDGALFDSILYDNSSGIIIDYIFLNDIITTNELVSISSESYISTFNNITVTESIAVSITLNTDTIDDISFTENLYISNIQLNISVIDIVNSTELVAIGTSLSISVNDSISTTENIIIQNTQLGDISVFSISNISESILNTGSIFLTTYTTVIIIEDIKVLHSFVYPYHKKTGLFTNKNQLYNKKTDLFTPKNQLYKKKLGVYT